MPRQPIRVCFLRPRQLLDASLDPAGQAAIADFLLVDQPERPFSAQVAGATAGCGVLFHAAFNVGGDAGVERAVSTLDEIDAVAGHTGRAQA